MINQSDTIVIRPNYVALCHADQRYFQGLRPSPVLKKKLPMALIHECCGVVVYDPSGTYQAGETVVMIPNQPPKDFQSGTEFYENYAQGGYFRSSGHDGFMREFVSISRERVVRYTGIPNHIAAITEFVSVGVHALTRMNVSAHSKRDRIVVWGSGSLAYVVATLAKEKFPEANIIVVGKNHEKLRMFSFVDEVYELSEIPEDFTFDHAFECVGGTGTQDAYRDIIRYIHPQGTVVLMGVSEFEIPMNTRDILEKGLTFVGSSRSGRKDFEEAVKLMENPKVYTRLNLIIHESQPLEEIQDIYRFFEEDTLTPFKTVAKWNI